MSHTDPKPGGWATKEKLTSAQMNLVRTGINNSPDIAAGGTYSPAAPVIINGSGALQLGSLLGYTSRSITRTLPLQPVEMDGSFTHQMGENFILTANTTGAALELPLGIMPHGATLNSVSIQFQGASGHGGLPAGMPTIKVYRKGATTIVPTQIGSTATDTSANVAAYEAVHKIEATALAHTVDVATNTYFLVFNGESGANAANSARIIALQAEVTMTLQPEW